MVLPVVNDTILTFAVFIGVLLSMLWWEKELLSPGGVVVPGFTALFILTNPIVIVYTLIVSIVTAIVIRYASRFSILYGRRRFAVTMLAGLTLTVLIRSVLGMVVVTSPTQGFEVVGIIIPGLVANEIHRQGLVPTLSTLGIISTITAGIVYAVAIFL